MIYTDLCDLLGIQYPIIQGSMAWIADASLASAVSEAGGLGIVSAMNADVAWVRNEIKAVRERTDKPFGVNIMLMSPFAAEVAQLLAEEKVPVVTTGAGNPAKYMPMWIEAGIKVLPVVPSVALAKMVRRAGAAAVIAEGGESGGHVGDLTTLTLVPQVVDVMDIPVIAAGGIADGRGIAAVLMLGAAGVQVGTRFLVAEECTVHQNYKNKVLKAGDIDTLVTGKRLGHPVRSLKNRFSREFATLEANSNVTNEELEAYGIGSLRKAAKDGDVDFGSVMMGQIAGLVKCEQSAKAMIEEMFSEAEVLLKSSQRWIK